MSAGRTPMVIGAGAAVVAVIAAVMVVRGSPKAIVADADAAAPVASSSGSASGASGAWSAEPTLAASALVDAGAVASGASGASGEPAASASPRTPTPVRDAGGDLVTAAADASAPSEAGAARPHVVSIDESSDGKTIELTAGQSLVLLLGANPTTGFDWSVLKAPAALGAPEMGYISGGDQMGAPGKRRLTWTVKSALPAGVHGVELGYARSFEKGVAPFKTFRFKVRAP